LSNEAVFCLEQGVHNFHYGPADAGQLLLH